MPNEAALSETKLPSVQEHARAIQAKMVQDGTIKADPKAAMEAAGFPIFSKGTVTLDENTGEPIVPAVAKPDFGESGVALPEPTETTGGTKEPVEARERNEKGQFVGEKPPEAPTIQEEAGTQAAEKVAEQVADAFGDFEEFEVEDPDLNIKYPVRVPKQYVTSAKRGYPRRADYDRFRQRLGDVEPVLGPLIRDGRIKQVIPLIERALADPQYGDYVWNGYQRAQAGLPLIEQAAAQAAQMGPRAITQQQLEGQIPGQEAFVDPLVEGAVAPLRAQLEQMNSRFQSMEQQREAAERAAYQQQQQRETALREINGAHRDLSAMYPGQFNPDSGVRDPELDKAFGYAQQAGYIEHYGLRSGIIFGAQKLQEIEAERLAATASPAAAALNMNEKAVELARRQAAQAAQAAGGGAPMQAPAPTPRARPSRANQDGTLKPVDLYMREMQTFLASGA